MPRTAVLILLLLSDPGAAATRASEPMDDPCDTAFTLRTDQRVYQLKRMVAYPQGYPWGPPRPGLVKPVPEWARDSVGITATFQNRSPRPVYLGGCGKRRPEFRMQKRVKGSWIEAYGPLCHAIGVTVPYPLKPGEVFTHKIEAEHYMGGNMRSAFRVDSVPGTYRVIYVLYTRWDSIRLRYDRQTRQEVASNTFQIRS